MGWIKWCCSVKFYVAGNLPVFELHVVVELHVVGGVELHVVGGVEALVAVGLEVYFEREK